ncbi:hypothetical protein [Salibacterium halotolerans]|uniref:DUF8042 domain-containing protein n=1 Tax=Salibacterium halotolerans TaxID=1884432 RepID=A0A1I5VTI6_9BACI|nr:hypothetical protein [Salibacterium halotolerans]SFQ10904.1 hypothetical protein SAMN05518683_11751 [Salibacterium halotolerans]
MTPMALEQAEQEFLKQYLGYLETVEEGVASVAYFYREGLDENGDRLLRQMLDGFSPLAGGNATMSHLFVHKADRSGEMDAFHQALENAMTIPDMDSSRWKLSALTTNFLPGFQRWRLIVDHFYRNQ